MRKGQEEIVGFVVIVVLVAIIAVIFLGFSLRSEPSTRESVTYTQFLSSAFEYTTDCAVQPSERARVKELIGECYRGNSCLSGELSCSALNRTLREAIPRGLGIGEDRPLKGFTFRARHKATPSSTSGENTQENAFITLTLGNCSGSTVQRGTSELQPSEGGVIVSTLEVCS